MIQRILLYTLLFVVAAAAAVLSFAALRDLALVCGFDERLAWLLPVTIDAGAAAGSLAWLGTAAPAARSYGRVLALVMLASSVGGNALGHGLSAYHLAPAWWVVVGVSAVAPAVVFAMGHLLVLAGRPVEERPTDAPTDTAAVEERPTAVPTDTATVEERPTVVPTASNVLVDYGQFTVTEVPLTPDWQDLDEDFHAWPDDPTAPEPEPPTGPDRQKMTDTQIMRDARDWAIDLGRLPSRDEMLARYRIGAPRCRRLREQLSWVDAPTAEPTDTTATPTAEEPT